jgi:hypothetical protein
MTQAPALNIVVIIITCQAECNGKSMRIEGVKVRRSMEAGMQV